MQLGEYPVVTKSYDHHSQQQTVSELYNLYMDKIVLRAKWKYPDKKYDDDQKNNNDDDNKTPMHIRIN